MKTSSAKPGTKAGDCVPGAVLLDPMLVNTMTFESECATMILGGLGIAFNSKLVVRLTIRSGIKRANSRSADSVLKIGTSQSPEIFEAEGINPFASRLLGAVKV